MSAPPLARVLVVDDEPHICESIKKALERSGYTVDVAGDADTAWARLDRGWIDVVLCDVRLPGADGIELTARIRTSYPDVAVVVMTAFASIDSAVDAVRHGALDYLPKPFNPEQLRQVVTRVLERHRAQRPPTTRDPEEDFFGVRGGAGDTTARIFADAQALAATDADVLITGEPGTGKKVLARYLHAASPRKDAPFVSVNCAAIPAALLASELFGHRRGAFAGALYSRRGSFELAEAGTLFLEDVEHAPLDLQAALLAAMEQRVIRRVGSDEPIGVAARVVAAAANDVQQASRVGAFDAGLYRRLAAAPLRAPALRERREDIVPLARHFIARYAGELRKAQPELAHDAAEALRTYDWPGNVRELRAVVEHAVIAVGPGQSIGLIHLAPALGGGPAESASGGYAPLREMELRYIHEVLAACGGNRTRAADILGVSPVTLWRRLGKDASATSEPPRRDTP